MKINNNFFRRRWLDFRQGNGIYLIFLITFGEFIVIQYKLLIDKVTFINSFIGGNIIGFALIFFAIYIPLSIGIGYWHRKNQLKVDSEALFKENKIGATLWLFVIDLIDDKLTDREKQEMREMLLRITKGKGKSNTKDITENASVSKSH
ncbi:MAG TPA: hypothetical protein VFT83_03675 [Nitrososphaeraceae archaeon]|nr:hypothetical protein [Nitrososphaeraceae archaeon]